MGLAERWASPMKKQMKSRFIVHAIWTAVASPVLVVTGLLVRDTTVSWLGNLLFTPGIVLTSWLGGMNGHMPDLGLMLVAEIFCNWALLMIVVTIFELSFHQRRERA